MRCPICGEVAWRHESDADYSYYVTKCLHDDFRIDRKTGKIVEEPEDSMSEDMSIRISGEDYDWLMQNRGAGAVKQKVHELIEYYKYNQKMAL